MANYSLKQTGGIDIQTNFRFEIQISADASNSLLGLNEDCTAYIQDFDVPSADGNPIVWHLPGGMKNYQAGKRTNKEIKLTFVIPSSTSGSWYKILEHWSNACYDMNTGTNYGKQNYCSDAIYVLAKKENDQIAYRWRLLRAQPTKVNYGSFASEQEDLLKVDANFVYDLYELTDGNGTPLRSVSN